MLTSSSEGLSIQSSTDPERETKQRTCALQPTPHPPPSEAPLDASADTAAVEAGGLDTGEEEEDEEEEDAAAAAEDEDAAEGRS